MKNKFYTHTTIIEGYEFDYPTIFIRKRILGIFYKTITNVGLTWNKDEHKALKKKSKRMCHLLNLLHKK